MIERSVTNSKKMGIRVAIGITVVLVVMEILFDPLSWLVRANTAGSVNEELAMARELWQSRGITDYRIHVEGFVPLACFINVTLTVRGGELAQVESFGMPGGLVSEGVLLGSEGWDDPYCSYRQLLVSEMFVRIENDLDRIDWTRDTLVARFSPEYGQVTQYRYGCCYRLGLLNPRCSDCDVWFTFSNLSPITD